MKTSQEKCVQLLIDRGACVDSQLYCGTTALHQASAEGFKDIVKILLKAGAMVDITEEYNITPLFTAAQYGQAQCLKLILQHAGISTKVRSTAWKLACIIQTIFSAVLFCSRHCCKTKIMFYMGLNRWLVHQLPRYFNFTFISEAG